MIQFMKPEYSLLLWLVAGVALLTVWAEVRRRRMLRRLIDDELRAAMAGVETDGRRWLRTGLHLVGLTLLVLALTDLRWGWGRVATPPLQGQVVFLVDVSRSMLAQDLTPWRLGFAKLLVGEAMDELPGHRFGLVAFAGSSRVLVPLTRNSDDVREALLRVEPGSVRTGGTRLDKGLLVAGDAFVDRLPGRKLLIMLSDGEDHAEANRREDVTALAETLHRDRDIEIIAIGLGSADSGSLIPLSNESPSGFLEYQGVPVRTRMQADRLRAVAEAGGGTMVAVQSPAFDIRAALRPWSRSDATDAGRNPVLHAQPPRYAVLVGAALVLFILARFSMPARSKAWSTPAASRTALPQYSAWTAVVFVVGLGLLDESPWYWMHRGNRAYKNGEMDAARAVYQNAARAFPTRHEFHFNQGVVHYQKKQWVQARLQFAAALATSDKQLEARAHFNLGNTRYAEALSGGFARSSAIESLWNAIDHYRNALLLDPEFEKARINIQLAQMLLRLLEQQPLSESIQDRNPEREPDNQQDQQAPAESPTTDEQSPAEPARGPDGDGDGDREGQADDQGQPDEPMSRTDEKKLRAELPRQQPDRDESKSPQSDERPGAPRGGRGDADRQSGTSSGSRGNSAPAEQPAASTTAGDRPRAPMTPDEAHKLVRQILEQQRQREQDGMPRPAPTSVDKDW